MSLWAVHVVGPNDLIAMPSHEVAVSEAAAMNVAFAMLPKGEYAPQVRAVVEPWPYSAAAHADELHRNKVPDSAQADQ